VAALISTEMYNLSYNERATVLEDVHGVGKMPPEECNPKLIQEKLKQMNAALMRLPEKPAFDEAQRLSGGDSGAYVNDPAFRLKFLRADRYDVEEAAIRMVRNLEVVRETFGPEGLVRPFQLSDMMLDRENQGTDTFLFSGNFFQVMPFRDRLGRRIIVRSGRKIFKSDNVDVNTRLKAFLYICQQLSNDVECQIKGVIIIGFPLERHEGQPDMDGNVRYILNTIAKKIVPVRIAAVHLCVADDPWFRLAAALVLRELPRQFRLRSRVHVGKV